MLKYFLRKLVPNPFDSLLRKSARQGKKSFLLVWNRGLGDIPLGLYAIVQRIQYFIPRAKITFITRTDLCEGFQMLGGVEVLYSDTWKRKQTVSIEDTLKSLGKDLKDWDVVIQAPDPTYWVKWQLGTLIPKLQWNPSWDALVSSFPLKPNEKYIGVHVQTETSYGYEKNWPLEKFKELFIRLHQDHQYKIVLFGFGNTPDFSLPGIVDLRGKTGLLEMVSIIKNRCSHLVVPDSGVLSITYFLDENFPLHIVSLWSDPFQGVLKQNVPSPNIELVHTPIIAPQGDLRNVTMDQVLQAITTKQEAYDTR